MRGGAGGDGGFAVGGTDHFALGEGFVVDELVVVEVTDEVVAALEAVPELLAFGDVGVRDGGGGAGHLWGWWTCGLGMFGERRRMGTGWLLEWLVDSVFAEWEMEE